MKVSLNGKTVDFISFETIYFLNQELNQASLNILVLSFHYDDGIQANHLSVVRFIYTFIQNLWNVENISYYYESELSMYFYIKVMKTN